MSLCNIIIIALVVLAVLSMCSTVNERYIDISTLIFPNMDQLVFSQPGTLFNLATHQQESDDLGAWRSFDIAELKEREQQKHNWETNDTFNFGGNTTYALSLAETDPPTWATL